jgi:NTP pyrophosphatase (non-canonical NTP hydrolase)
MTLEEYTAWTFTTAAYPGKGTGNAEEINYLSLGLIGETGEVADKVKKALRVGIAPNPDEVAKELGDVAWYWVRMCQALGTEPSLPTELSSSDVVGSSYLESIQDMATTVGDLTANIRNGDFVLASDDLTAFSFEWTNLCHYFGFTPSEIFQMNIRKIEDRKARGVLTVGEGDNR